MRIFIPSQTFDVHRFSSFCPPQKISQNFVCFQLTRLESRRETALYPPRFPVPPSPLSCEASTSRRNRSVSSSPVVVVARASTRANWYFTSEFTRLQTSSTTGSPLACKIAKNNKILHSFIYFCLQNPAENFYRTLCT